jgi:protein gp37
MSTNSKIEWTDTTWNPVRGCTKISAGCKHCYAETFAERFRGVHGNPFEHGFDLRLAPHKLSEPFQWSKPQMVFVNSMSDLFHEKVPEDYIIKIAEVMVTANWHTYQVLTKRTDRLRYLLQTSLKFAASLEHIWWGTTVENKKAGIPRIQYLRDANAAVNFLSIEPLLEDLGTLNLQGIQWVIVGGESGNGARPMLVEWVTSIRNQCIEQKVPFFFKQWGGVRKSRQGRNLDGRTYDEFPDFDHHPIPPVAIRRALEARLNLPNSDSPQLIAIA